MAAIGSLREGHPTRSARASELVCEIIARNHAKESRASLVPAGLLSGLPLGLPAGLIDSGAILALLDRNDQWHEPCVEMSKPITTTAWLTTEAVLTETFHPRERKTPQFRRGYKLLGSHVLGVFSADRGLNRDQIATQIETKIGL